MTGGLFQYPPKAAFGRVLPKSKVFTFGKVTRRVRDAFATDIERITWLFKLAPETTNLPPGAGVNEIQVFGVELKQGVTELSDELLRCIDAAIGFPIFFEVFADNGARVQPVAAYKRPSEADASKWVVGDYFHAEWAARDTPRAMLPVALNLGSLYEQMLRHLLPMRGKPEETLQSLADRCRLVAIKQREFIKLESQLKREKQFNRKVELNMRLRNIKAELEALASAAAS